MFGWLERRGRLVVVGASGALGAFALVSAIGLGTSGSHAAPAVAQPIAADYEELAPHVVSRLLLFPAQSPARDAPQPPPPEYPPFAPSRFTRPVTEYLAYAGTQLELMAEPLRLLETYLSENNRGAAEGAWEAAFARYLRLGAVYLEGPVAALNEHIDGSPGGLTGGAASPQFTGLHRIEFGLWTGVPPSSLLGWARQLSADRQALRAALPHVSITPLDYATRAHEILEDAARDLLSGADVPWSQEGVLGTASGLAATEEVIATLRPLISTSIVDTELGQLRAVIDSLAAAHGGKLPTNTELTQHQSEELDATLGQALEALAQVPGELETKLPPTISTIPRNAVEIDP